MKKLKTSFLNDKVLAALLCMSMILALFTPITANADTGPKPSVRIIFENMGDELCYGTLLSKNKSTGPARAWDGIESHAEHNGNENYSWSTLDYETWKAFVEYEDSDDYFFLQEAWVVSETKEIWLSGEKAAGIAYGCKHCDADCFKCAVECN